MKRLTKNYEKLYEAFAKTNNVIENVLSEGLLRTWELFNHETKVALISAALEDKLKDDPAFEMWIQLTYPQNEVGGGYVEVKRLLISNKGRFYSLYSDREITVHARPEKYVSVNIGKLTLLVHRALGFNFLPKKKELGDYTYDALFINHKDLDKHNNDLPNLEWCLPKENTIHAFENGALTRGKLDPRTKPILVEVVAADSEFNGAQFVLFGKKELKLHGFNQGNTQRACMTGDIVVGCKFRYVGIEQADEYPHGPPDGFELQKIMIPKALRTTVSWN